MVHSMMFFKNVKLVFWVDAFLCAVYVKNRCPYNAIKKILPMKCGMATFLWWCISWFLVLVAIPWYPRNKETNSVQGVTNISSWGIQICTKHTVSMMKWTRNLKYLKMWFFFNLLGLTILLSNNLITWINSYMKSFFKRLKMRYHILKGGSL